MNKKLDSETGTSKRLMMLLAKQLGSHVELAIGSEEVVGKYCVLQLHTEDMAAVFPQHTATCGTQIKSYHPKHPEAQSLKTTPPQSRGMHGMG